MKKIVKNNYFISFILSFILGALIILPNMIKGAGIYSLIDDFNLQQIPFNELINNLIKSGGRYYTWQNELGSNLIGTFSFYNMFSPFNLIGYLFPANWFPYLIGPIFILKYAIAGLTSYMFIQRHVKNKKYAIIGSLLYAFSGFQICNMLFYHFHDIVAFFPLVLYSLDKLVFDKKKGLFTLSIALIAFTNWFFFIGIVIFTIIYYLIQVFTKTYKFTFKSFLTILLEGIIGTSLACIVLMPSMYFVSQNPRVNTITNIKDFLFFDLRANLDLFRALFLPNESMSFRSTLYNVRFSSVDASLPLVSLLLVIPYIIKHKKDNWCVLVYVSLIIMFIPLLNSIFYLFNPTYYARWLFMPILILALISSKTLDEKLDYRKYLPIMFILLLIYFSGIVIYDHKTSSSSIISETGFLIRLILYIGSMIYIYYGTLIKNNKLKYIYLLVGIFGYVFFMGNYFVYENKGYIGEDKVYTDYLNQKSEIKIDTTSYRMDSSNDTKFNLGFISGNNIVRTFNSNISGSTFKFYKSIGEYRDVSTNIDEKYTDIKNFLSVKYILVYKFEDKDYSFYDKNYKKIDETKNYMVYENDSAYSMGIDYKYAMLDSKYSKLSNNKKRELVDDTLVLSKDVYNKYKDLLSDYNNEKRSSVITSNKFKFINDGFKSEVNVSKDTILLYTIPYEKGWNIKVNNVTTNYDKTNNGFIIIKLNKGKNVITGSYYPEGLKLGKYISLSSLLLFIIYIIFNRKSLFN